MDPNQIQGMMGGGQPPMGPPSPMGPPQNGNPVGANILQKLSKTRPTQSEASQQIGMLTTAIKQLDSFADLIQQKDKANAVAVRRIIVILGEILKTTQHNQLPDNIMNP